MKKIIGIILTVLGSLGILFALIFGFIFGGLGMGFSAAKNSNQEYKSDEYSSCTGVIVSTSGSGSSSSGSSSETTISYTVDGLEYQGTVNMYSSSFVKGDTITVYYDLTNPNRFEVPELSEAVFGTMGTIFSGIGIVFLIIFGGIGAGMIVGGIILIRLAKKDNMY